MEYPGGKKKKKKKIKFTKSNTYKFHGVQFCHKLANKFRQNTQKLKNCHKI